MSERALDEKGRWRSVTVSFRMSPEESALLNNYVYLSGLTKQDYITACVLKKEIIVRGSPRTYIALKNTLCDLTRELHNHGGYTDEQMETLRLVVRLAEGLRDNAELP